MEKKIGLVPECLNSHMKLVGKDGDRQREL